MQCSASMSRSSMRPFRELSRGRPSCRYLASSLRTWPWRQPGILLVSCSAVLYLVGSFLVTLWCNVPMNRRLVAMSPSQHRRRHTDRDSSQGVVAVESCAHGGVDRRSGLRRRRTRGGIGHVGTRTQPRSGSVRTRAGISRWVCRILSSANCRRNAHPASRDTMYVRQP